MMLIKLIHKAGIITKGMHTESPVTARVKKKQARTHEENVNVIWFLLLLEVMYSPINDNVTSAVCTLMKSKANSLGIHTIQINNIMYNLFSGSFSLINK